MRDTIYVKSQLDNLLANAPTQQEQIDLFNYKVQLLTWIYNLGNLRTEDEIKIKLRNLEEEKIALDFMNQPENSLEYKRVYAQLKIMQDIMN